MEARFDRESQMAEARRRYDPDFRAGAIRIVTETGKSVAQVAKDLGINETTLATWVSRDRAAARKAAADGFGRASTRNSSGCGGRTLNWRWSVMSSSVRWSSG